VAVNPKGGEELDVAEARIGGRDEKVDFANTLVLEDAAPAREPNGEVDDESLANPELAKAEGDVSLGITEGGPCCVATLSGCGIWSGCCLTYMNLAQQTVMRGL
jgi:hypothetical protein